MNVIVISGASGSGKSTLIKHLASQYSCPYLSLDDHLDPDSYPTDMKDWLSKGADLCQISTPRLTESLRHLKTQNQHDTIFVEDPFGRCRVAMRPLIDYVILLNTPLEICLSRVINRYIQQSERDLTTRITDYLTMYDDHFRAIYRNVNNQVKEDCDLVIDDVATIEQTSALISNWMAQTIHA